MYTCHLFNIIIVYVVGFVKYILILTSKLFISNLKKTYFTAEFTFNFLRINQTYVNQSHFYRNNETNNSYRCFFFFLKFFLRLL